MLLESAAQMHLRRFNPYGAIASLVIASALCAAATALRIALDPYLLDRAPWATYFLAVAVGSWISGWRAGVLTALISSVIADYWFIPPRYEVNPAFGEGLVQHAIFFTIAAVIIAINEIRIVQQRKIRILLDEARQDIAYRIGTEKALAESEAKFRAVAETASTAIYIHDGQKLIYVNPTAEKITGYTRDELYKLDMWNIVHPECKELVRERAAARFKGEASPDRYEYKLVHKNGNDVWVDFGATVIDYDGKRCILANAFDVTQRKLSEEALIRSEKLASAGRLAATIAHEINNPLEAITNLLYLARTDGTNATRYVEMAEGELRRVAHIARQTLGFYRDAGTPEKIDIALLVRDVLNLYAKRLEMKDIKVHARIQDSLLMQGSSGEFRQIISNLVSNAIDALIAGGTLSVAAHTAHHGKSGLSGIRLIVVDNGSGIPPQVRKRVFDAFFTTKQDVGTGLGLWVTRNLVEKHGGSVRLRTSSDPTRHGTAFSLFFPVSASAKHDEQAA